MTPDTDEAEDMATRLSESLIKIAMHDKLTADQRASLLLAAGFLRGQAARIAEFEAAAREESIARQAGKDAINAAIAAHPDPTLAGFLRKP